MSNEMLEEVLDACTDLCDVAIRFDIDCSFVQQLSTKQYIYEKETEGEID